MTARAPTVTPTPIQNNRLNTPDAARAFVFGPDQDHVGMRTLDGLVNEFNATRRAREAELNQHYIDRAAR